MLHRIECTIAFSNVTGEPNIKKSICVKKKWKNKTTSSRFSHNKEKKSTKRTNEEEMINIHNTRI